MISDTGKSGVQVNYSMINPPDFVGDELAFPESQVLPYRNADECREVMLKVHNKYLKRLKERFIKNETSI